MFSDLENDIDGFYDLSEVKQGNVLLEINKRAAADKAKFRNYLSNLGYGVDSNRTIFYEALWRSPKGWGDFAFQELKELIASAETGDQDAISDVGSVFYLVQLENMEPGFYQKNIDFATTKLSSPIPEVRSYCLESMIDIHDLGSYTLGPSQISEMRKLLQDKDFAIRITAFSELKEINLLPKNFKLPMLDILRAKLTGKGEYLK